jgi:hypothetical protein
VRRVLLIPANQSVGFFYSNIINKSPSASAAAGLRHARGAKNDAANAKLGVNPGPLRQSRGTRLRGPITAWNSPQRPLRPAGVNDAGSYWKSDPSHGASEYLGGAGLVNPTAPNPSARHSCP